MADAFVGSEWEKLKWHAWRREAVALVKLFGVPLETVMAWGRWASKVVALHCYTPPSDFHFAVEIG